MFCADLPNPWFGRRVRHPNLRIAAATGSVGVDDQVGLVDSGALCTIDGGGVVDSQVACGDVAGRDRVSASVVEVGAVQLVSRTRFDSPWVAVAHPLITAGPICQRPVVGSGDDQFSRVNTCPSISMLSSASSHRTFNKQSMSVAFS